MPIRRVRVHAHLRESALAVSVGHPATHKGSHPLLVEAAWFSFDGFRIDTIAEMQTRDLHAMRGIEREAIEVAIGRNAIRTCDVFHEPDRERGERVMPCSRL